MPMKTATALSGAALLLTLAACGQPDAGDAREKQLEEYAASYGVDADVKVDEAGNVSSVAVGNALGGQSGTGLTLPPGFPEDVAVHPSANLVAVSPLPGGFAVQGVSTTSADELAAWHRGEMQRLGWTEANTGNGGTQLTFDKPGRQTSVTLIPAGAEVSVQIMTMQIPG